MGLSELVKFKENQTPLLSDTLERICHILHLANVRFLDILQIEGKDFARFLREPHFFGSKPLENLASYLGTTVSKLSSNQIDFTELACRYSKVTELPEHYAYAAFGRRRTSATSVDFVELKKGWKFRSHLLKHLDVNESALLNPFGVISIRFITELCELLHSLGFTNQDFYEMGAYSYYGNRNSLLGKMYAGCRHPMDIYSMIFEYCLPFYEENCTYRFRKHTSWESWIEVKSTSKAAEALKVKNLGNVHLCYLKAGFMSCAPMYLGLPAAKVTKTSCVHQGDHSCLFKVDYEEAVRKMHRPLDFNLPSLS